MIVSEVTDEDMKKAILFLKKVYKQQHDLDEDAFGKSTLSV